MVVVLGCMAWMRKHVCVLLRCTQRAFLIASAQEPSVDWLFSKGVEGVVFWCNQQLSAANIWQRHILELETCEC